MNCTTCHTPMKPLFTGFYCVNDCDIAKSRITVETLTASSRPLVAWAGPCLTYKGALYNSLVVQHSSGIPATWDFGKWWAYGRNPEEEWVTSPTPYAPTGILYGWVPRASSCHHNSSRWAELDKTGESPDPFHVVVGAMFLVSP